ncbi:MAG: HEPN domain-containing protein [Candidatus Nanoarchaeia archaeon]
MREETINWRKQAEKYLKVLFLETKKAIAPRHNLISLGRVLELPEDLLNSIKTLNSEYILARYPNAAPYEIYSKEKADLIIKHAEKILK